MRKALVLVLVASSVALWPSTAVAADSFTFFGSGWGHGLGMSQWGAFGLAEAGWTRGRILTHFYSGTKLVTDDQAPKNLRIGLVQGRAKVRVRALSGSVDLVLGDPKTGDVLATVPAGETWTVRIANQQYGILDASGKQVGEDVGGTATNLYAVYVPNGAMVRVPEAGHTYNRGSIEFNVYSCDTTCKLRLILNVGPEQYLYGIAEVPSSWPTAALQAQAVAARTYAFRKAAAGQHRPGCNCALYASPLDQVYAGWDKEGGLDGDRWVAAVDATASQVVTYKGDLIQAFYSSSSGGYTENNENVWGGTPVPYLRGVCDPGDYTPDNPNAVWQVTMTASEVTKKLGLGIGTVTGFTGIVRGVSGRIITVVVQGESGSATVSGWELRSLLGLNDDRVWINVNRQVVGSIRQKYDEINCRPGLPTSRLVTVAGGERQKFEQGTIYSKDGAGAHELFGALLDFFIQQGGPQGALGFPTSDVVRLDNGATKATFEHGTIVCTAAGACRVT